MTDATHHPDDGDTGYSAPTSPEEDHPLWLGGKIAAAMFLADAICSVIGFESPTWSILVAAFLATQPPQQAQSNALKRVVATGLGLVLGVVGAWANQFVPTGAAAVTFVGIGLVCGWVATRDAAYLFTVVVATVITFTAQTGNETVLVEALRAALMIGIGCIVGPTVVWAVESLRARLAATG